MIQRAKKEVFGHFQEFGRLDRLDIAYFDSTKCFQLLATLPGHKGLFKDQTSQKHTEVEQVRPGRYSSQLQLRSGLYLLVCPCVCGQNSRRTASWIS